MPKNERKTLQAKLQKEVNLYARLRDCAGRGGANCISCGTWKAFDDLDGGHFIPTTSSATRYDVRNVSAQCVRCNRFLHGNLAHYYEGMVNKWGQEVVDDLMAKEHVIKKWSVPELKAELERIQGLLSELS